MCRALSEWTVAIELTVLENTRYLRIDNGDWRLVWVSVDICETKYRTLSNDTSNESLHFALSLFSV